MWLGNPILDANGDMKGICLLHALPEGNASDQWHGLVQASVLSINPLGLKYPDNTNTGEEDFKLPESMSNEERAAVLSHLINTTNYNPVFMDAYFESIENISDLISVITEDIDTYWFAGFGVLDMYVEGETGAECWNRMQDKNGALGFLSDTISTGEMQEGIRAGVANAGIELPETVERYTPHMKKTLVNKLNELQDEWDADFKEEMDEKCEEGLVHEYRRGSKEITLRGKLTPKELYLPKIESWVLKSEEEGHVGPTVNSRSVENYRKLLDTFNGDGYSIEPHLNRFGDIVIKWRTGPTKVGEAVLMGDGGMHLDLDYMETTPQKLRAPKTMEMVAEVEFNETMLTNFIQTGVISTDD